MAKIIVFHVPARRNRFGIWRAFFLLSKAKKYFGGYMAKIIEFYVPQSFHRVAKWFPPAQQGKVLAFPLMVQKSA